MNWQWVDSIRINRSAVAGRAKELGTRRSLKKEAQAAAYLNIVKCVDLTALSGADTNERVRQMCDKALRPVDFRLVEAFKPNADGITTGAVCVYPKQVLTAVKKLGKRIPVASVATGFSAGQTHLYPKKIEIGMAVDDGAMEIDVVISRDLVLRGYWQELFEELAQFRSQCGDKAKMKTILEVSDLETLENVAKASAVAIAASQDGDFIKTSTGFGKHGATLEAGIVMTREIRRSGRRIGLKPAGGIRSAKDALLWYTLMLEELGPEWCRPDLFRVGAGSGPDDLLTDLNRQLSHCVTGVYSDSDSHPRG